MTDTDGSNLPPRGYDMWGAALSPFALKLGAMLAWAGVRHRWLPREGGRLENLATARLVARARRDRRVVRHGGKSDLDELPAMPFLIDPDRTVHYDSSALAEWIDEVHPQREGRLVPEEPALRFIVRLIDEAFDEFGLYMVHHNRWVLAAADNGAGRRLADEFAALLPPGGPALMARQFPKRQVRRLSYLFSVAAPDFRVDLPKGLTPPARPGFPATHDLLDHSWHLYLSAMETVLEQQPYLLGQRFTLADASAYGQLSMNLTDGSANAELRKRAPRTHAWLCGIRDHAHLDDWGPLELEDGLRPLLGVIGQTFIPLMRQNERAYIDARSRGETRFNEAAFDQDVSLYRGEILGSAFRHVVKSFQVRTWRDLRTEWETLSTADRATIDGWLPNLEADFKPMT